MVRPHTVCEITHRVENHTSCVKLATHCVQNYTGVPFAFNMEKINQMQLHGSLSSQEAILGIAEMGAATNTNNGTVDCCPLLSIVIQCCQLLSIIVHCYPLLSIVVHCYPLLSIVIHCCPLLLSTASRWHCHWNLLNTAL